MIEITINEQSREVADGTTLAQLLVELEIISPAIAVEVNQRLRPRDQFGSTVLESGDVVEIVTLVGGG